MVDARTPLAHSAGCPLLTLQHNYKPLCNRIRGSQRTILHFEKLRRYHERMASAVLKIVIHIFLEPQVPWCAEVPR